MPCLADTSNAGGVAVYHAQGQTTLKAWLTALQYLPCLAVADTSNSDAPRRIHQDKRRSKLGRVLCCICPVWVSADTPNAGGCVEYTRTNDAPSWGCCACPVSKLIHHSPVAILPPRNLKLKPTSFTHYPFLNASLMQTVNGFNAGKNVVGRRKMVWVEGV